MNSDEIKSMVTRIIIVACSGLATKYGVDGNTLAALAGAIATLAAFGYGVWENRGKKKVPVEATAVVLPPEAKAQLPNGTPQKGDTINLAPLSGTAKVVG